MGDSSKGRPRRGEYAPDWERQRQGESFKKREMEMKACFSSSVHKEWAGLVSPFFSGFCNDIQGNVSLSLHVCFRSRSLSSTSRLASPSSVEA